MKKQEQGLVRSGTPKTKKKVVNVATATPMITTQAETNNAAPEIVLVEKWYHYADLMAMFGASRNTVRKWVDKGMLVVHDLDGFLVINKAYVDAMIEKCGRRTAAWLGLLMAILYNRDDVLLL